MPDWDDGRTWPRRPRSPADAIRPPKPPRKDGCPFSLAIFAVVALLSLSALVTFVHVVLSLFTYADEAAAAGLFVLMVLMQVGRS